MAIFTLLLIAVCFTACNNNDTPLPKVDPNKDVEEDSWTIDDNADSGEVYKALINGIIDSLKELSTDKINKTYPKCSVDAEMNVEFNDYLYLVSFVLNYNLLDESVLKFGIEIADEKDKSIVLGAYFMEDFLYIKLMDGEIAEIKIPIENKVMAKLLPLDLKTFDSKWIADLAIKFNALIDTNDNIIHKKRKVGNDSENEYSFDINLPSTLSRLVSLRGEDNEIVGIDADALSLIVERLIGVSFEDIEENRLPESTLTLNFSTINRKLSTFKMDLEVGEREDSQNTIFGGDVISVSVDLTKFEIAKTYKTIAFFASNEFKSYSNYIDNSFGLMLNIIEKGETPQQDTPYFLKAEMKIDLEEIDNNQILIEVLNIDKERMVGFYVYNSNLSIYGNVDGDYIYKTDFPIDIIDIYNKVSEKDLQPEDIKRTALEYVAYFLGAFRLYDKEISFTIDQDFYDVLLPNFCDLISYIDEAIEDVNLQEELELADIDIVNYLMVNEYVVNIDLSEDAESFVYILKDDIEFPEGVKPQTVN